MLFSLYPLGDQAVVIELGQEINKETLDKVRAVSAFFDQHSIEWVIEYVPAFTTVSVFYDPLYFVNGSEDKLPYEKVCDQLKTFLANLKVNEASEPRKIEIPVCYGGELGPDLEVVAEHNHLTPEEVIHYHSMGDYLVYMIGFAPGFPYIGGMPEEIATPRKESPRLKIPAGSVGIAGKQTGVYPIETPGGWQLIGRTPMKLFRPGEDTPSILRAGDRIQFKSITLKEFQEWEDGTK
ncbi:5-oxoprolinase subunit PxpB [Pullulanibacillus sp. KACC 23026]|uniref:5-oxoprolinase subunit PxpB n=1 Tax=Pullulanibacillus sp. KACC 23026 TaxID=3028315 RepID=UPI0023B17C4A|nr:5-oxoprolinase subunit PxpB [Pullulanibacillus sp. KACC 23026]WEG14460.1 5-oxoprolinase subunit PxpB [Pullulanibacillus sp. KACC 23026]